MANILPILTLRLIRSALNQKEEVKPAGNRRERSQGWAVMPSHDVASLPSGTGLPLGQVRGRASPFLAKSVFSASKQRSLNALHAAYRRLTALVLHAIMSSTRKVHSTDEVLRRPTPPGRATADYKPYAKGQHHAPVAGTGSPRPRLQGYQQRRSRGAPTRFGGKACSERQNLRVPLGSAWFMGLVSLEDKAAKWPEGTFSPQSAGSLRNNPQQPTRHKRRFIHIRRNQHGIVSHC